MKQINDLIVCTVPKGATDFKIEDVLGVTTVCLTECGLRWADTPLPPGQYEIIGLASEIIDKDNDKVQEIGQLADIRTSIHFRDYFLTHGFNLYDSNIDLLFIQKLK